MVKIPFDLFATPCECLMIMIGTTIVLYNHLLPLLFVKCDGYPIDSYF